jgi:hypothetical protein
VEQILAIDDHLAIDDQNEIIEGNVGDKRKSSGILSHMIQKKRKSNSLQSCNE